jgi:methionine-S-sulfoxide reductase
MAARSLISSLRRSAARLRRGTEVATFAAGCFWGVEAEFRELGGVIDSHAGFTGGSVSNPSYEEVCAGRTGHAEAVRVIFDPARVGYEQLLATCWEIHDPTQVGHQGFDIGEQYRSAVFAHDSRQMRLALASRGSEQRLWSRTIATEVLPAGPFYVAEPYHRRLYEREGELALGGTCVLGDLKSWLALADPDGVARAHGVPCEPPNARR